MKKQLMLGFAMVAGLSACSIKKSEKNNSTRYGYRVAEYNDMSGTSVKCQVEHWFNSEAERCAALPNDSLNQFCNPEGRANLFEKHGCDKSLAANSSIKDYFGGATRTRTVTYRGVSPFGTFRDGGKDSEGCWKGEDKDFNFSDYCKSKYP